MARTADMRNRFGESAMWSLVLTVAIGYIAFS
jgi:hypothetical protein